MDAGIHELTAGYALDALESDERRAYEAHLAGCERCSAELASFWEVTSALALAAGGPQPDPALRDRLLASVRAERQNVVPLPPRRIALGAAVTAVAAVAAVVAVGLGVYAAVLGSRLDRAHRQLAEQRSVSTVISDPGARDISLTAGSGRVVVDSGGRAVLILGGIQQAPAGKTYEIWVIRKPSSPKPAGLFAGGKRSVVPVSLPVVHGDVVAVTLEPAGGSSAPTSAPIAASTPV